jgi:glucose-6-phosphate dehydrogenase assembly protein OpcA
MEENGEDLEMKTEFVDVASLERELRELWERMASKKPGAEQEAVTRACVHNLIVYAPGEKSDAEVNSVVAEITVQNPGRVFILLADPASKNDRTNAWVSAQCYRTAGKREQVCCEQIMLRAEGEAVREVPMILAPLIIPDMPVFLWWRSKMEEGTILKDLLESADRVIIDSALNAGGYHEIRKSSEVLKAAIDECAFSDLDWARLTFWRDLVARLFDSPDARKQLPEMNRVEIQAAEPMSYQPLFLASWLASRLDWKFSSPIQGQSGKVSFECMNGNRKTEIVISGVSPKLAGSNLQGVQLHTKVAKFSISVADDPAYLEYIAHCEGMPGVRQLRKFEAKSEASLLRDELQILGCDRAYEQALQFLFQIL